MKVLAIDIGGTKTAFAAIDTETGHIDRFADMETPPPAESGTSFLHMVCHIAKAHLDDAEAIAVSLCELVSADSSVTSGHRVTWHTLPVRETFAQIKPTILESDVRCAALAEARAGAGKGFNSFFYLNLGTGISSALVIEGKPWSGQHGSALVFANGPTRVTGPDGRSVTYVLEDIAGGAGLSAEYARVAKRTMTAADILIAARAGDLAAQRITSRGAQALGNALGQAVNTLDPAAIIVGGGLANASFYLKAIEDEMRATIWSDGVRRVPFLTARLGGNAPLLGAALAAHDRFAGQNP